VLLAVVTGGLSALIPDSVECKLTDTKSGETHMGYGTDRHSAKGDAHSKFK